MKDNQFTTNQDEEDDNKKLLEQNTSGVNVDDEAKRKKKKIICGLVIGAVVIGVALAIILPLVLKTHNDPPTPGPPPGPKPPDPFNYQEYNPYTLNQSSVEVSDWIASGTINGPTPLKLMQGQDIQQEELSSFGNGLSYKPVNPQAIPNAPNNPWATQLGYQISLVDNYQARIQIYDNLNNAYTVRDDIFPRPIESFEARLSQVGLSVNATPFAFSFRNIYANNNETIVTTDKRKLMVSEKFSEIGLRLPTKRVFGLGQHNSQFTLKNGTYSLWAKGQNGALTPDLGEGGQSGPHIHPFVLCQTKEKDFFGIFFVGTTAQTFEVLYFDNFQEIVINYITLGGQIEMYVFMRGTAQEIIQQYHAMIGFSVMPPYFALGVFQGSDQYNSDAALVAANKGYSDSLISIEGMILDSYYDAGQLFTTNFTSLKDEIAYLQSVNQHIVLGISSGLIDDPLNKYRSDPKYAGFFVTSNLTNLPLTGEQNGVHTVYPDFFNPKVSQLYVDGLSSLAGNVGIFDGINFKQLEFGSQVNGEIPKAAPPTKEYTKRNLADTNSSGEDVIGNATWNLVNTSQSVVSFYYLPFIPGFNNSGYLDTLTISSNATHAGYDAIKQLPETIEFYLHNANGHMGLKTLSNVVTQNIPQFTKRPILYADSTWSVHSGAYGAALITNVYRSWDSLRNSIAMTIGLSMYGFSNAVTDVCGTIGPLDQELCGRWMQAAAFLPMARNYYAGSYVNAEKKTVPTDPSEFYKLDFAYQYMATAAIKQRFSFTRYIYSQMYLVHREGGSLVRPLFFDYPSDDECFVDTEQSFFLGDSVKVSPVLTANATTYSVYFPEGNWAELGDIMNLGKVIESNGTYVNLTAQNYTNVHLKEGKILPYQKLTKTIMTTTDLTQLKTTFYINRDESHYADGYILVDDGISANSYESGQYTFWKLRYAEKSINFWVQYGNYTYSPVGQNTDLLEEINILNAGDLSTTNFACYMGVGLTPTPLTTSYSKFTNVLTIKPKGGADVSFQSIGFIKFGDSNKEVNICNGATAMTYDATLTTSTDQQAIFALTSRQPNFLEPLVAVVTLIDNSGVLNVTITTADDYNNVAMKTKFRPKNVVDDNKYNSKNAVTLKLASFFSYTLSPFSYVIFAQDNQTDVLYTSSPGTLYLSQYLVVDAGIFSLNAANNYPLMGLGERAGELFYKNEQGGIHSRYAYDQANPIDDGLPPGRNMYGVQPLYVYQAQDSSFVGVFNLNAYATDFILYFNGGTNTNITTISIGGIIQKFFFLGAKPDQVIVNYQRLVGYPQATPLWSFGWQQCRFGYVDEDTWWGVVQNYTTFALPLDTMWADIDYMDDYKIFTISQNHYPNLTKYVEELHKRNMTFVPIIDPAVAVRPASENYTALVQGLAQDIFIKTSDGKSPLTGGVFCGNAYFPDLHSAPGVQYWQSMLHDLYSNQGLEFDGIWLDENEATNFCNGYCIESERPTDSLRNKPFYVPGWRDLEDKALGLDGLHANGLHEYDLHNLFSLTQVKATAEYLSNERGLIPYVLTRGNFPGIGQHGGHHWLGDNWTTQQYLKHSVDGIYSYQLFGLPFLGSDICGFNSDATDLNQIAALCTRWHQLGSLYPFSRNHNQNATLAHEPYRFNDTMFDPALGITHLDLIRDALYYRYNWIRYFYSAFNEIGEVGGSFFKPLFFDYPNDPVAYQNTTNNILLGRALKASIQTEDLTVLTSSFYFPADTWCQIFPNITENSCFTSKGALYPMKSALTDYYLHMRSGNILPYQQAQAVKVNNTKNLVDVPMDLYILPYKNNQNIATPKTKNGIMASAYGFIYFDDGIHNAQLTGRFEIFYTNGEQTAHMTFLEVEVGQSNPTNLEEHIGTIKILYASNTGMNLDLTLDPPQQLYAYAYLKASPYKFNLVGEMTYDPVLDVLSVTPLLNGNPISFYDVASIDFGPQLPTPPTPPAQ